MKCHAIAVEMDILPPKLDCNPDIAMLATRGRHPSIGRFGGLATGPTDLCLQGHAAVPRLTQSGEY